MEAGTPEKKSTEERKALLARQVQNSVAQGRRVESQGDFRAVLVRRQWGMREKREVVEVDEYGNVSIQRL
jgi:hypothetical protein